MKNLKLYAILGLSALLVLSACKKDELTEDPGTGSDAPVLTLSSTTLTVEVEGGVYSVAYQVTNPVDEATVSVDLGEVDWVTYDVTESTIDLTVAANESDSRTATLTVSYPGAEDVTLTVEQEAYVVEYDNEYELNYFEGYYYRGYGSNGEALFNIWLSDIGTDDYGYTQAGGHYYSFYLYVENADASALPTGTYTASASTGGDMVLNTTYSAYYVQYDNYYDTAYLSDGYITVSADGDTYTIEGVVTDDSGETHYLYYNGPAAIEDESVADVTFTASTYEAEYWGDDGEVMGVDLFFTDMYYYGYGYVEPPGNALYLDTYMPYSEYGKITPGTYTVGSGYDSMTINYADALSYYVNMESYYSYQTDYITSGTMTVTEGSDGTYSIVCDFGTYTGATVKCNYTGEFEVNMGWNSSLKDDIEVNIGSDAYAYASNYGDYWRNGGNNWYIQIVPNGVGGGVMIDLNAVSDNEEEGIPSGTYTAASAIGVDPEVGEFAQDNTWYYEYDENGDVLYNSVAAVGSTITITNEGDGYYKIEFDCVDDTPSQHRWYGEWEGYIDGTLSTSASTSSVKPSAGSEFKTQKTTDRKAAKFTVVSSNESRVLTKTLNLTK